MFHNIVLEERIWRFIIESALAYIRAMKFLHTLCISWRK